MRRARSPTNGTVSAESLSLGGGEGGGVGGSAFASVGAGAGVVEGAGTEALLAEAGPLSPPGISSFVKYRNPATPMATREITVAAKGHIQFGVAEAGAVGGFFSCGVE